MPCFLTGNGRDVLEKSCRGEPPAAVLRPDLIDFCPDLSRRTLEHVQYGLHIFRTKMAWNLQCTVLNIAVITLHFSAQDDNLMKDIFMRMDDNTGNRCVVLEEEHGFKIILHQRDFMPGEVILCNIAESVRKTRRMIMLLTRSNFITHQFLCKLLNFSWRFGGPLWGFVGAKTQSLSLFFKFFP